MIVETAKYDGESGAYVSVLLDKNSVSKIDVWFLNNLKKLGLKAFVSPHNDLHVTVMFSENKAPDPSSLPYLQPEAKIQAVIVNLQVWPGHDGDGYIVAGLRSNALVALNKFWIARGCKSENFEQYKPHLTLASGFLKESQKLSPKIALFLKQCNERLKETPLKITLFGHRIENIS